MAYSLWWMKPLTPDSSRFWPMDQYRTGISPPSLDKQFVRDYLESQDWDKKPPAPRLPEDIVRKTQEKYVDIYQFSLGWSCKEGHGSFRPCAYPHAGGLGLVFGRLEVLRNCWFLETEAEQRTVAEGREQLTDFLFRTAYGPVESFSMQRICGGCPRRVFTRN